MRSWEKDRSQPRCPNSSKDPKFLKCQPENWYGNEQAIHIPSGIHVNLRDCYDSFRKMGSIADMVLPGHDLKVLEKEICE